MTNQIAFLYFPVYHTVNEAAEKYRFDHENTENKAYYSYFF